MIVASNGQYAAMATGSKSIGMFKHVHASVDAGAFAIPHAENTIVFGALKELGLLASPDSSGGQLLVYAGLKVNIVLVEIMFGLPHGLINAAQRRTPIS